MLNGSAPPLFRPSPACRDGTVASSDKTWQWPEMQHDAPRPDRPSHMAGGLPLAAGMLIGTAIGVWQGQPTIGFLCGAGVGAVIALAIWLVDRRR
jgi:hypothetical protein